jgi:hypothetical protein
MQNLMFSVLKLEGRGTSTDKTNRGEDQEEPTDTSDSEGVTCQL